MVFITYLISLQKTIDICSEWHLMIVDPIESNLYRKPLVKYKCKPPKNIFKFHLFEKAVELNLPSILNNTQFVSPLKDLPCNFVSPNVIHNLQLMRSSTFNLWNFVLNTNVDQLLTDLSSILSNTVNSPFKDF